MIFKMGFTREELAIIASACIVDAGKYAISARNVGSCWKDGIPRDKERSNLQDAYLKKSRMLMQIGLEMQRKLKGTSDA